MHDISLKLGRTPPHSHTPGTLQNLVYMRYCTYLVMQGWEGLALQHLANLACGQGLTVVAAGLGNEDRACLACMNPRAEQNARADPCLVCAAAWLMRLGSYLYVDILGARSPSWKVGWKYVTSRLTLLTISSATESAGRSDIPMLPTLGMK